MGEKLKIAFLVFALGILWGCYEFYDFFSTEQMKMEQEAQVSRESLEKSKGELTRLTNFAEGITDIKNKLKKTNSEFEEALEFIPRNLELSKLLARLNVLARNSGIEIDSFKPGKEPVANATQSTENKAFFDTTVIDVRIRGGFSQTVMFFDQISRLKRILNVESLKMLSLQSEDKRSPASSVANIETQVVLKTYRFSE